MTRAPTILEKIAAERRGDVEKALTRTPLETLISNSLTTPDPNGRFYHALATPGLSVIAEVKRASPSRGDIAGIPDVASHAKKYSDGGAAAISVLTEPRHFKGRDEDLELVASSSGLPVLRKDFLIDPYQVWEARQHGASACLLIVALLPDVATLKPMLNSANDAGLDALVEVHDERELEVALEAGAAIVGVNHRNLHTFEIDLSLFGRLRPMIPEGVIAVAESGIHGRDDAKRMEDAGADAILVGEHVAQADDPAAAVRNLRGMA